MSVVQDGAGLVVKRLHTVLAGVPLQMFLVEAVFGDVLMLAVGAEHPAIPSHHSEQFGCRRTVGKRHKQR